MRIFILEDDMLRITQFRKAAVGHDVTIALDMADAIEKFTPRTT